MREILGSVLLVTVSSCAMAFQPHVDSNWTIDRPATCGGNQGLWILDALGSGAALFASLIAFKKANESDTADAGLTLAGLGAGGLALGLGISAAVGEGWADQCGRALEQQHWHPGFKSKRSRDNDPDDGDDEGAAREKQRAWDREQAEKRATRDRAGYLARVGYADTLTAAAIPGRDGASMMFAVGELNTTLRVSVPGCGTDMLTRLVELHSDDMKAVGFTVVQCGLDGAWVRIK